MLACLDKGWQAGADNNVLIQASKGITASQANQIEVDFAHCGWFNTEEEANHLPGLYGERLAISDHRLFGH